MSFDISNLAPVNPSAAPVSLATGALRGAPRIWTYVTEDTHATVDSADYFNGDVAYGGAYHLLEVGDVILVVIADSGALSTTLSGWHIVNAKADGTLDVRDVTALTTTDTD